MRIVIVGPGALGSLLTARLSLYLGNAAREDAGNDDQLCLLDHRPERASFLSQRGIVLEESDGRELLCNPPVTADPAVCAQADIILLCVKSNSLAPALETLRSFLQPDTILLAMQNGIAHLPLLHGLPCTTGVGVTSEGANMARQGHVRHGGRGLTRLGLLENQTGASAVVLRRFAGLLDRAGLAAEVTEEPLRYVWGKLFVNVGINALTAINRCRNGELLDSAEIRDVMASAVREAVEVARAKNIPVEGDPVAITYGVCETTRNNISSMHQDVRNQRQTEIGAINGAIVAEGERFAIQTPVNRELVRRIREIEASYGAALPEEKV